MKKQAAAILFALLLSSPAWAQTSSTPSNLFLGGKLGLSSVSNDVGSGLGFGLSTGWFFHPNVGVGLLLDSGSHSNGVTSFLWGAEAIFRMEDLLPGASIAGQITDVKFSGGPFDGSYNLGGGGKIGYDYHFGSMAPISLGAELGLLWVKPQSNTLTIFNAAVTAKFWFQ